MLPEFTFAFSNIILTTGISLNFHKIQKCNKILWFKTTIHEFCGFEERSEVFKTIFNKSVDAILENVNAIFQCSKSDGSPTCASRLEIVPNMTDSKY